MIQDSVSSSENVTWQTQSRGTQNSGLGSLGHQLVSTRPSLRVFLFTDTLSDTCRWLIDIELGANSLRTHTQMKLV